MTVKTRHKAVSDRNLPRVLQVGTEGEIFAAIHENAYPQEHGTICVDRGGVIRVYTGQQLRRWGRRPDNAIGSRYRDILSGDEGKRRQEIIDRVIAGDTELLGERGYYEERGVKYYSERRGREITQNLTYVPVRNESQETIGVRIIVDDLTKPVFLDHLRSDISNMTRIATEDTFITRRDVEIWRNSILHGIAHGAFELAGLWVPGEEEQPKAAVRPIGPDGMLGEPILAGGWDSDQRQKFMNRPGMGESGREPGLLYQWMVNNGVRTLFLNRQEFEGMIYDATTPPDEIYNPETNPNGRRCIPRQDAVERGVWSAAVILVGDVNPETGRIEPIADIRAHNKGNWDAEDREFLTQLGLIAKDALQNSDLLLDAVGAKEDAELLTVFILHLTREILHEVKNPLVTIGGFADIIRGDAGKPESVERVMRNAGIIVGEIARLEQILNRFGDMLRREDFTEEEQEWDLAELVKISLKIYGEREIRGDVRPAMPLVDVSPSLPLVVEKPRNIYFPLRNLMHNAFQNAATNSRVRIRAEETDEGLLLTVANATLLAEGMGAEDLAEGIRKSGLTVTIANGEEKAEVIDGYGMPPQREGWGVGLRNIAERCAEAGYNVGVEIIRLSPVGEQTTGNRAVDVSFRVMIPKEKLRERPQQPSAGESG